MMSLRCCGSRMTARALRALRQDFDAILAYCAALQLHLGTPVQPMLFCPAGREPSAWPCALVSISPFVPGGLRRLVVNVNASLIHELSAPWSASTASWPAGRRTALRSVALELGGCMLHTGSWPIDGGMDIDPAMSWPCAHGLVCGPHLEYCWPVPHHVALVPLSGAAGVGTGNDAGLSRLVIWPKRVYGLRKTMERGGDREETVKQLLVGEKWEERDKALRREWHAWRG